MSAFVVSHNHINALVSAALDARMFYWDGHDRVYVTRDNAEEIGRILLQESLRSVSHRYSGRIDEKQAAASYHFVHAARPLSPVQLITAVHFRAKADGCSAGTSREKRSNKSTCHRDYG